MTLAATSRAQLGSYGPAVRCARSAVTRRRMPIWGSPPGAAHETNGGATRYAPGRAQRSLMAAGWPGDPQRRMASGARARAGPGPSPRLRSAWVLSWGVASVAAGASAVRARAQWPPDCAREAPRGGVAAGLCGARGGGGGRAAPRSPVYAVHGAQRAARVGELCGAQRRSGRAGRGAGRGVAGRGLWGGGGAGRAGQRCDGIGARGISAASVCAGACPAVVVPVEAL